MISISWCIVEACLIAMSDFSSFLQQMCYHNKHFPIFPINAFCKFDHLSVAYKFFFVERGFVTMLSSLPDARSMSTIMGTYCGRCLPYSDELADSVLWSLAQLLFHGGV